MHGFRRYRLLIPWLSILISGCGYPKYTAQVLNSLSFEDKRPEEKNINVQEFIRPKDTEEALDAIEWQRLSPDADKNTILNILDYVQKIKQVSEKKDYWQFPKETIKRGGDCEDKTFLLLSMLIQAGLNDAEGVKGHFIGQGHMWVEYKEYILDPSLKTIKLIPISKSMGYVPYFKFNQNNIYFCLPR